MTMTTITLSPGPPVTTGLIRARQPAGAAIIKDFQVAWSGASPGAAGLLFQAGSISKPITALTALELAARGQVSLDGDVNDYLTSWQVPGPNVVSLRQLLGHTAGLGVPFFPGYQQDAAVPSLQRVLDGTAPAVTPAVRPDPSRQRRFSYSGGGYAVVQQLIIDVTATSFVEATQALVLEPLGMTSSTFDQPLATALHQAAARPDWHIYPEAAAAGLWTTPEDLARFTCALTAAATGRPSPIAASTAAQMLTPHTPLPVKGEWNLLPLLGIRPPTDFGLGMFLHGQDRFSHIGGAHGFFSMLTAGPDGAGAVVMTAAGTFLPTFRLLSAISRDQGRTTFRQPVRKRLHGLPGIRTATRPRS
jgi:CubicO group peptidase (beta-lactamase class C family)